MTQVSNKRVWRHFLINLLWPVLTVVYLVAVVAGITYAESLAKGAGVFVALVFLAFPILVFLIRDMWQNAKRKVEWENWEKDRMLKKLSGD